MNRAMVHIQGDRALTSSVDIAHTFDKEHKNVLQIHRNILPTCLNRFHG
jgi:phage regulator Rha-like protein